VSTDITHTVPDTTNGNGSSNGSNSNGHCHENGTRFTCFTIALRVSSCTKVQVLTRTTPQDQAATPTKMARAADVTAAVTRVAASIATLSPPMRFVMLSLSLSLSLSLTLSLSLSLSLSHSLTHTHTLTHTVCVCVSCFFDASRSHFDVIHGSHACWQGSDHGFFDEGGEEEGGNFSDELEGAAGTHVHMYSYTPLAHIILHSLLSFALSHA
jgi:hypothetical protein